VVDVAGKVRHPGVYRLPPGARVQDAVTAAGGMAAGVDPVSVNLARRLTDGEQLVIGLPAPPEPAISGAGGAASRSGGGPAGSGGSAGGGGPAGRGPVDLNTASVEQLDALPGVGPVLAQRILDWRSQHGRFDTVDQLSDVAGIGAAKLADLTPLVTAS
jgi:competence protein ComEA